MKFSLKVKKKIAFLEDHPVLEERKFKKLDKQEEKTVEEERKLTKPEKMSMQEKEKMTKDKKKGTYPE